VPVGRYPVTEALQVTTEDIVGMLEGTQETDVLVRPRTSVKVAVGLLVPSVTLTMWAPIVAGGTSKLQPPKPPVGNVVQVPLRSNGELSNVAETS